MLRIDSMKQLINAIGGVNVDVKDSDCLMHHNCANQSTLDYVDTWGHLNIHLKPGLQHMNGDQAVGYSRFRHDWCSDPCRIMRQDQVVRAIVDKIKGDKLNTFMHVSQLITLFRQNVTTNLSQSEMLRAGELFLGYSGKKTSIRRKCPTWMIRSSRITGDVIIPDEAAKARLVRTMLVAPPLHNPRQIR